MIWHIGYRYEAIHISHTRLPPPCLSPIFLRDPNFSFYISAASFTNWEPGAAVKYDGNLIWHAPRLSSGGGCTVVSILASFEPLGVLDLVGVLGGLTSCCFSRVGVPCAGISTLELPVDRFLRLDLRLRLPVLQWSPTLLRLLLLRPLPTSPLRRSRNRLCGQLSLGRVVGELQMSSAMVRKTSRMQKQGMPYDSA